MQKASEPKANCRRNIPNAAKRINEFFMLVNLHMTRSDIRSIGAIQLPSMLKNFRSIKMGKRGLFIALCTTDRFVSKFNIRISFLSLK